jgi:hypothetical protein
MPTQVLRTAVDRPPGSSSAAGYQSRMIERYRAFLAKCEDARLLDVGPVIGSNISFFFESVRRISLFDLLQRLPFKDRGKPDAEELLRLFDFKNESFDAISLWDIPDHLDNDLLAKLVERCRALLAPNGICAIIASATQQPQPYAQTLRIQGAGCLVTLQKELSRSLPYFYRSNRDMELAFKPMEQFCSFVCMNGIREFIFKR